MKVYFVICFCIVFLFDTYFFADNFMDLKEILCNHYQSIYLGSEDKQRFKIMNLFREIDKKIISINISENMEIELDDKKEVKEVEAPWEFEIIDFTSLKSIPLDPDGPKELLQIDRDFLKRREKVKNKSNYFKEDYKIIYINENNFNKCNVSSSISKKIFLNFTVKFNILSKEFPGKDKDELKGKEICFKIIGIREKGIVGYSVLEREIVIYGIIE